MDEMKTNRQQNAGRAKIMVELTACQTRHGVRRQNTHALAQDVTEICFPIVRRPPEVATAPPAVVLPRLLVFVVCLSSALGRMIAACRGAMVLAASKRNRAMRIPAGVDVVRTAPQHRMGE
jgi:hypothetical protein